jgi:ATP-dependent protease HslVU (ClpYQ) ATPase subunit
MSTLVEDLLFDLPDGKTLKVVIDAADVRERLAKVVQNDDLRKYIL